MLKPIHPRKPEEKFLIKITGRERHLISVLRQSNFGKTVIHKADGLIIRCEPGESILINEEGGVELGES